MKLTLTGRHLLAALTAIILTQHTQAQIKDGSISFVFGDKYEMPKKHDDLGFIGNKDLGYLQIGHDRDKSLSFQHFNNELHLTGENFISLKDMPNDYQNVAFPQMGGKYYWIFGTWQKSDETERLFVQEVDVKNSKLTGTAKEIVATDKLAGVPIFRTMWMPGGVMDKWNIYYAVDSNKMLVQYRKKPERRNDSKSNDIIGFQVFDDQMNKLWGKEIRMPYTEQRMDNEDYCVDRDGNVYTLAKVYSEEKAGRRAPNYRMEILKWSKDKNEVTKIPFKFTDKFVNAARMTRDFDGNLMVVGYYSRKRFGVSADGVFLLKLNEQTGELSNVKKGVYEFPSSILSEFESARRKRKNERKDDDDNLEADHMVMRNIVVNSNGSIQVFGEEAYSITTTTSNGRTTTTSTTYYYNDILGMNIGADGELKWIVKVPKQQRGVNSGLSDMSFKLFSHNSNQYLFFMDNMKNLDLPVDEVPAAHLDRRGGIMMVVKIDENGAKSKAKIFDVREEDKRITITDFSDVGVDKMVGRAHHRRESQPLFISFQ